MAFQAGGSEETMRALGGWETTTAMLGYLRGTPLVRATQGTQAMADTMPATEEGTVLSTNFRPMWK